MGYMIATGGCYGCNRIFTFNPELVPSAVVNGRKLPICEDCVAEYNKHATVPIRPLPGAYEGAEV